MNCYCKEPAKDLLLILSFNFAGQMKKFKRFYGKLTAFVMLLLFSAALIPLDFYHNHSEEILVCREKADNGSCRHKLHLSQESKSCWVCAVHYDKSYYQSFISYKELPLPLTSFIAEKKVSGFYVQLIFTALRGPPAA